MSGVATGSAGGGEREGGVLLDVLEPGTVRESGLEPKLAIRFCKPNVSGPEGAVRGPSLDDSDTT